MWKDYSWTYIKKNRASGISVLTAAFISAFMLSLLCCLFYNFWVYEIERLEMEEGAWKMSRLTPLEAIKNSGELQLKRKGNSWFLRFFFGLEGELAGNALKAQKKHCVRQICP